MDGQRIQDDCYTLCIPVSGQGVDEMTTTRRIDLSAMTIDEATQFLMKYEGLSEYRAIERAEMAHGILPALHPRVLEQERQERERKELERDD